MRPACLILLVSTLAAPAGAQGLTPAEIDLISRLDGGREAALEAVRTTLDGHAARVARHYVLHTGEPPTPSAFFIAFEALGDADAVEVLAQALLAPPAPETGPEIAQGVQGQPVPRFPGEIVTAIEAAIERETTARDPRVGRILAQTVTALRAVPDGRGNWAAGRTVELLGRCASDAARDALRALAADPDSEVRALALAGLGRIAGESDLGLVTGVLQSDPDPQARVEAAGALARLPRPGALPALRAALAEDPHPRVIDAAIAGLAGFDALPTDRDACLDAAARGWETHAVTPAFACWSARATDEELTRVALEGSPVVRVLAMTRLLAPPAGTLATTLVAPTRERAATRARFLADATRLRLLRSVVEILSRPAGAEPDRPGAIAASVAWQASALLHPIAGGDMALAIEHADRISTPASRTPNDGRLAASEALWRADPAAYDGARRVPQALVAGAIAILAGLLAMLARSPPAALAAAVPPAAWVVWTLTTSGARQLPPLTLAPLTVFGIASIAAAAVAGVLMRRHARSAARSRLRYFAATALAVLGAGMIALAACAFTRWYGFFPVGTEGWELFLDPIGASLAAMGLCVVALGAGAVARRRTKT